MSTFIDLLRIHHDEFEHQFGNQLSHDSRRAIYAMLSCSQWYCEHCQHDDRLPLSFVDYIVHKVSNPRLQI
ncbi:MAG: hypothetical protein QNK26_01555 [Moritella sp.]|uniref:hypothetical protein n=1 Tax=Moritella sp. TaxID=78556 RepID=UPI0029A4B979|nr:hypothetical protein [Moritella sp.]MDX2319261.1 hypothetical protein [Moritella sp.]